MNGHLECLKYAYDNGCEMGSKRNMYIFKITNTLLIILLVWFFIKNCLYVYISFN